IEAPVRYESGEGIMGLILDAGYTIAIERIADEPRFLGKLGLYDPALPFIGAPIRVGKDDLIGVLAAQPSYPEWLGERSRFMEMVANLIAQSVSLLRAMEEQRRELVNERDQLKQTLRKNFGFENVIGHTPAMIRVFERVHQVAKWNTTVLIRGESGTGKEVIANAIHYQSPFASGPFIKLNCAALPDNLLESELFGHEKGAFSGAINQRKGRFELANHGTLFLDEIGEISLSFQAKLLRVLQEGEFERVGASQTLKVQVRIIAATNKNLEEEVEAGRFREDLYYRLNVMPINMPPLRDRLEDLPELTQFLLGRISRNQGGRPLEIKESAIRMLMRHDWPGNVRELENCLERAAIMSEQGIIDRDAMVLTGLEDEMALSSPAAVRPDFNTEGMDEREQVIAALEQAGWVQAKAARLLNMTPRQIAYRVKQLNIRMKQI
ncbi:MAG: nif-specific transcriptional activator NifA, partial [Methylococcus sp.]